MTFPSPIGELHFSIVLFATLGIFLWIVSVPYRGATFLNIQFEELAKGYEAVSVPYRGATFLNIFHEIRFNIFRSCFRPLSGSYISQYSTAYPWQGRYNVSVPYRGATFLNEVFEQIQSDDKVSVPYRGATFLNESKFSVMSSPKTVSVPYRGATFLNRLNRLINQLHRFPSPIGELHFSILSLAQLIL